MKKAIMAAFIILALSPALAFADFQIGALGMYKGDPATLGSTGLGLQDFTFGADARLNLWIVQGSAAVLYYPADVTAAAPIPASLMALTDIGLCLDVLFIRIGAGIGPNFAIALENGPSDALPVGVNMKLTGEIMLGSFSIGVVGYYYVNSFSDFAASDFFSRARPFIGVSALFKLF